MIYMAEIISKKLLRNSKAYAGMLFIGLLIIACVVSICIFVSKVGKYYAKSKHQFCDFVNLKYFQPCQVNI